MVYEVLTVENQYERKALSYTQQSLQFCRDLKKESRVLDLCCGFGRHAMYLCERDVRASACDGDAIVIKYLSISALD